ncbi:MAG: peptidoglycan DD-metalloendopeptidase family protein [Deltaproteobacteria bacterium]|nr:peptidoglycan DD-metalloendopeptidase family protein [Deltaproteobacteria bacterium]
MRTHAITSVLLCFTAGLAGAQSPSMEEEAQRFASRHQNVRPAACARTWRLPFATRDRQKLGTLRMVSRFGAKRTSYVKGHLHTGADLVPRGRLAAKVMVYPLAAGAVCSIHLAPPHTTVVIAHRLPSGDALYSSYKHLTEVSVETGQQVDHQTALGRLFTRREAREHGGPYAHLHLELRKRFDDWGAASWTTMSRDELEKRFIDPYAFLERRLRVQALAARGLSNATAARMVAAARELLGIEYELGGRLRGSVKGIDCQGVIFYALERVSRCGWRSYSTMPTVSVPSEELGVPVPGLDPASVANLDVDLLRPGDVIHLLASMENPAEPAIGTLGEKPVWVWHVGLYAGGGDWIHADFVTGQVREESLTGFIAAQGFEGILATRMAGGPKPRRCKRHTPMRLPARPEPDGG